MANLEAHATRTALVISPNTLLIEELEPLLEPHLDARQLHWLKAYPAIGRLAEAIGNSSPILFLDVSTNGPAAFENLKEAGAMNGVRIVALLAENEPDLILRCLRSGASEFLVHPFTQDQVEAAFSKLSRMQGSTDAGGNDPAKIIAVMPAKGACGATTIASNLALQWKKTTSKRVLLADLDPLTGNLSFLLKAKSTYSFLDALRHAHELDRDLWKNMVTQVKGVDVLLSPDYMPDGEHDLRDPSGILEFVKQAYDVIILDTNGVYGEWNLNIARTATDVLLVTTNELPALQAAQRALSYLDSNRVGRWKLRLLVNRYLLDVGLSREVISTALHSEVFDTLPSDYEAVQRALMDGKSLPSASGFGKAIAQLVVRLGGQPDAEVSAESTKKPGALAGLFGGLFSKSSRGR